MREHRLEVADVLHAHQQEFLERWGHVVSRQHRKVLGAIGRCRTAALGSHLERCDSCSYEYVAFDSCRDRHCPKCQSTARDRWLQKQASSLLPVPYSHVVFTLPKQLAALALRNQRLIYALLFRAVSETLMEIAADRHRLGARIGILAVLHTWNQQLQHHPHLHCLVPAGGRRIDACRADCPIDRHRSPQHRKRRESVGRERVALRLPANRQRSRQPQRRSRFSRISHA